MLPGSCYLEKAPNQVKGSQLITKCNSYSVSLRRVEASGGACVCVCVCVCVRACMDTRIYADTFERLSKSSSEAQPDPKAI